MLLSKLTGTVPADKHTKKHGEHATMKTPSFPHFFLQAARAISCLALLAPVCQLAFAASPPPGSGVQAQRKARLVVPKVRAINAVVRDGESVRLVVKFAEGSEVRVRNGEFVQKRINSKSAVHMDDVIDMNATLKNRPSLLRKGAFTVEPRFSRPEEVLDAERALALANSDEELADQNLFQVLVFDKSVPDSEVLAIANRLLKLGVIESLFFNPKVVLNAVGPQTTKGIATTSSDDSQYQFYRKQAYDGISIDSMYSGTTYSGVDSIFASLFGGWTGAGMRFIDIEFAWNTSHEDLKAPTLLRDADSGTANDKNHGTAVLGVVMGQQNGFGVIGLAPDVEYGLVNATKLQTTNPAATGAAAVADAIDRASAQLRTGDVILIEVGFGLEATHDAFCPFSYTQVPVEDYDDVYLAIKKATSLGRVVVETSSNGYAYLDDACFQNKYQSPRDSGAILVAASKPGTLRKEVFTSYGTRIDLMAQGSNVISTSFTNKEFSPGATDPNQYYTSSFDGTSSAGAIVAGTVLSLQGIQKYYDPDQRPLTPDLVRSILKSHGTNPADFPGLPNDTIGVMPNLQKAINYILGDPDADLMKTGSELLRGRNPLAAEWAVATSSSGGGIAFPFPSVVVGDNGVATIYLIPSLGYTIGSVSGTCAGTLNTTAQTFTTNALHASCSVVANFLPVPLDPPTIANVVAGDSKAVVNFIASVQSGNNLPIVQYTATCGSISASGAAPPIRVTGLTNGVSYSCSVTATNFATTSAPSGAVMVTPMANAPVTLASVQSRKTHGAGNVFDLPVDFSVPVAGSVTVESRRIGGSHTIIFQFNAAISSLGTVTALNSSGAAVGTVSQAISGDDVIVSLAGVPDNQRLTITLPSVNGSLTATASMGFLVGDVNSNRAVNAVDVIVVKQRSGQPVRATNFQMDTDTSGYVDATDVTGVKARSGQTLAP